jgi:predicted nucleic acid-binding protein
VNQYLLDTNVISELRRVRPHGAVVAWLNAMEEARFFVSAVTLGELQVGVEKTRRQDPLKAEEIERWVDLLAATFEVLPMDALCFRECARIMHNKQPELLQDAMIAATARIHGLVVATRNERDFRQLDVQTFNPFKS